MAACHCWYRYLRLRPQQAQLVPFLFLFMSLSDTPALAFSWLVWFPRVSLATSAKQQPESEA